LIHLMESILPQPDQPHRYARVSVNIPRITGVFDYAIPEHLMGKILPGCLVEVPFGNQIVQGIVLQTLAVPEVEETKEIAELVDPSPVLTEIQIGLARWLEQNSTATLSECLHFMLLPGLRKFAVTRYSLTRAENKYPFTGFQKRIIDLLSIRGTLTGRQIDRAFPKADWQASIQPLVNKKIVSTASFLPRPALHPKLIKRIQLTCKAAEIDYTHALFNGRSEQRRRVRKTLMEFLSAHPEPIDLQWAKAHIEQDITPSDLEVLVEQDYIAIWESEIFRDPVEKIDRDVYLRHPLTPAQGQAWERIEAILANPKSETEPRPILLHGVTGSGKTELYFRAAESILARGQRVLWLVPEISLTPQTVGRLIYRFPGQIGLVHSGLTEGERYDTWQRARSGKIPIIVGPRSALFTPLENIGLIIIDECHDSSFYQSETAPVFNAVDLAMAYARLSGAACILGTATPDVAMYFRAKQDGWPLLNLPERAVSTGIDNESAFIPPDSRALPSIQVVDMRAELRQGNRSIFSAALTRALYDTVQAGQQSILFLNRRGSSTHVFCRECGYVMRCPRCDLPLTAHAGDTRLLCHTCGYQRQMPSQCPECKSKAIRQVGIGTETVEKEIKQMFPLTRILRWDADSRKGNDLSEIVLTHFKNRQYDILIGTQMVAKGLDFPAVSLVGMVLADIGLNLPDYRSPERTFQVLTQVAGRAGRSGHGGQVILQTYQPEHYAIQAASRHDFDSFYRQEIEQRRKLGYPPFAQIIRLETQDTDNQACRERCMEMADKLQSWLKGADAQETELLGPLPCFFARQNDSFRWQIVLRGGQPLSVLLPHKQELADFRVEVDPPNLL
jgi:primosomal protein N' (replication factor Y) (superfamily II helicase)